jgi:hypothetical protein
MDPIKDAFEKVKQDLSELKEEINSLKHQIIQLKEEKATKNNSENTNFDQTTPTQLPTQNPFQTDIPTQNPTMKTHLEASKPQNMPISTGNEGVPTDKQTNRQTNQQTDNYIENNTLPKSSDTHDDFEKAKEILDNLDSIKKEIRLKFKRLTPQEMSVFSVLYSFIEQNTEEITYKMLANNLNLSESSIRDYINKLITKGIPIVKVRQNNKKITLDISPDLQKIASLSTINKLREL